MTTLPLTDAPGALAAADQPADVPLDDDLVVRSIALADIPRTTWDGLLASTSAATPFSRWTFHRAWWDAYGATAHEQYLACSDRATGEIRAIVPLMHRHEVEPEDAATATVLRRRAAAGTSVPPEAKAVFMAASYHADYATILGAPADITAAAKGLAEACATEIDPGHPQPWDVIDLRRLREIDPALPALDAAFRRRAPAQGWEVRTEIEDVCPVVTLPVGLDWEEYLSTLERHARHEIRRKVRRAETAGELRFGIAPLTPETVDRFIALHQARWGEDGLFPPTAGGERSRRFLHRLAELEALEGSDAQLQMGFVDVGGRVIFATVGFDDGETCYFYNAGTDPNARELSPGVAGTAAYVRDRLLAGRRRFDFLRGNEVYKYEWGAVDEPIHRVLVTRSVEA